MRFSVSQLVREASGSTKQHQIEDRLPFHGSEVGVEGSVMLVKTDRSVWVTAPLHTQIESECGRCLDSYTQPIDVTIDEEAVPRLDPVSGVRLLDDREERERLVIDENHILDLTETALQYIALGLPMRPLCRPDCAGLCDTCGVNRNREPCGCRNVPNDSRWGPLLDVLPSIETTELRKN